MDVDGVGRVAERDEELSANRLGDLYARRFRVGTIADLRDRIVARLRLRGVCDLRDRRLDACDAAIAGARRDHRQGEREAHPTTLSRLQRIVTITGQSL